MKIVYIALIFIVQEIGHAAMVPENNADASVEMSIYDLRQKLMGLSPDKKNRSIINNSQSENVNKTLKSSYLRKDQDNRYKRDRTKTYNKANRKKKRRWQNTGFLDPYPRKEQVKQRSIKKKEKSTLRKESIFDINDYAKEILSVMESSHEGLGKCAQNVSSSQKVLINLVVKKEGDFDITFNNDKVDQQFLSCLKNAMKLNFFPPHENENDVIIKMPIYTGVKLL